MGQWSAILRKGRRIELDKNKKGVKEIFSAAIFPTRPHPKGKSGRKKPASSRKA